MPDPSRLRDSTQIVLPKAELDGHRADIERQFMVTLVSLEIEGSDVDYIRIIASPVVIKEVSEYLVRHGISLP